MRYLEVYQQLPLESQTKPLSLLGPSQKYYIIILYRMAVWVGTLK